MQVTFLLQYSNMEKIQNIHGGKSTTRESLLSVLKSMGNVYKWKCVKLGSNN